MDIKNFFFFLNLLKIFRFHFEDAFIKKKIFIWVKISLSEHFSALRKMEDLTYHCLALAKTQ